MWLTEFELRHDHRPEVLLQNGRGCYTEPYHRFDIGFIEEQIKLDAPGDVPPWQTAAQHETMTE